MKKLNYFLVALATVGLSFFTSCDDDTEAVGPTITFTSGSGLVSQDTTIYADDFASFAWVATKGDANLEEFTIRFDNVDVSGFPKSGEAIDKDEYNDVYMTSSLAVGKYAYTFIATDKDGLSASKTITVTVILPLAEKGVSELGAGASTLGSYYSVENDMVYKLADAKANPTKIDLIFTSTATVGAVPGVATFISPKNAGATEISSLNRITKYQKVTIDFDTATPSEIDAIEPTADKINVVLNDVIVFKTHEGKKGIFVVNALTIGADGTTDIDIKVKQ